MLLKLDAEFAESLDDESRLEPRLAELARQRRWHVVTAVMATMFVYGMTILMLVVHKSSISPKNPLGTPIPLPMVILPTVFLPLLAINVARAASAHSEIRTLLLLKKLRQPRSND